MREILFKAKSKDSGEWVEGTGIVRIQKNTYDTDEYEIVKSVNYDELDYYIPSYDTEEIDISTLCEYTGLKDKNGVKIFENDIVKGLDYKFIVKWNKNTMGFQLFTFMKEINEGISINVNNYIPYEVIGNIFDNKQFDEEVK